MILCLTRFIAYLLVAILAIFVASCLKDITTIHASGRVRTDEKYSTLDDMKASQTSPLSVHCLCTNIVSRHECSNYQTCEGLMPDSSHSRFRFLTWSSASPPVPSHFLFIRWPSLSYSPAISFNCSRQLSGPLRCASLLKGSSQHPHPIKSLYLPYFLNFSLHCYYHST